MSKNKLTPKAHYSVTAAAIALILAVTITVNVLCVTVFDVALRTWVGEFDRKAAADPTGLDTQYNKADVYTKETLETAYEELTEAICEEGMVLLKWEEGYMPYEAGTTFSFFSHSSVAWLLTGSGSGEGKGNLNLKKAFTDEGFLVNETLWDFYYSGEGKNYSRGSGVIAFGDDEDWSVNECPLSVLQSQSGLLESAEGTTAVFILSRTAGEGRDLARGMYRYTSADGDRAKSYLEPDSVELEILRYLDQNFEDVVLIVNSANTVELGWTEDFEHIHSVIWAPGTGSTGLKALPRLMKAGGANFSGHLTDTYAYDMFSAPATQNFGDFEYLRADGSDAELNGRSLNYVTYMEGIYVGYKYYETRYEDYVLGIGNAGDYAYAETVQFPFGYGRSYTDFEWSGFDASWDTDVCTVRVTVTNKGTIPGKDVVQVYAQTPYTDYDRANLVEKAAVSLVGYAKTGLLEAGASETVELRFNREQLKSYDYTTAKTYIMEAGDYYVTAAGDAHRAINNILAAKELTEEQKARMFGTGDAALTARFGASDLGIAADGSGVDAELYSKDTETGTEITNRFDFASENGTVYLTRQNWTETFPVPDGDVSAEISTNGNPVNAPDGKNYIRKKIISDEDYLALTATGAAASRNPAPQSAEPVFGRTNGLQLINLRGLTYDDPLWEKLLDQLEVKDYNKLVTLSGYGTAYIESVEKPKAKDLDGPTRMMDATSTSFASEIVMAQTWNDELLKQVGNLIGNAGLLYKISGWYAPALNLHRTPFGGRNFEYYSEDPFVSGHCASVVLEKAAEKGVYSFIKHFALNNQEDHRGDRSENGLVTWSNEQAIRETYLASFEIAVKTPAVTQYYFSANEKGEFEKTEYQIRACTAIMSSFNRIGYTWAGGNYDLLTGVLKNEWGFRGFVITDFQGGDYMEPSQMIYAGGSGVLNSVNRTGWAINKTDGSDYSCARSAIHDILYTVANSSAMNGMIHGLVTGRALAYYEVILMVLDLLAAAGIALLIRFGIFRYRKQNKAQSE